VFETVKPLQDQPVFKCLTALFRYRPSLTFGSGLKTVAAEVDCKWCARVTAGTSPCCLASSTAWLIWGCLWKASARLYLKAGSTHGSANPSVSCVTTQVNGSDGIWILIVQDRVSDPVGRCGAPLRVPDTSQGCSPSGRLTGSETRSYTITGLTQLPVSHNHRS